MRQTAPAAVACALALTLGMGSESAPRQHGAARDFGFEDINPRSESYGQRLVLRELYAERGLVLQFVASWCEPCRRELPHLEELYASGRAPVVLVAADEHGYRESILIVAERRSLTAPILYVPVDETEPLGQFYDYEILPATYLIDRHGLIRQVHEGAWSKPLLAAAIERELEL
jgi:cytochrome c-type biogenesis protein